MKKITTYYKGLFYIFRKVKECEYFVDDKGRKQGTYCEYYDNGQLLKKCNYVDDLLEGESTTYCVNGNIVRTPYVKGKKHGEEKYLGSSGFSRFYDNDKEVYK